MGMSNENAGFLAADAAGGASAQAMLNSSGLGSLAADAAGGTSLWNTATSLINPSTSQGGQLWNTLGSLGGAALANSYQNEQISRIRDNAAKAANAAAFKPYTVTSPVASTNVTSTGMTNQLSPTQQTLFDNLQSQTLAASQTSPVVSASDLFNKMNATVQPQNERDRLALEQRMAAQGRLGVATAAYGGTPEQLALAKAQQEQLNNNALNAELNASKLTNQNIANMQGMFTNMYAPVNQANTQATEALYAQQLAQKAAWQQAQASLSGENQVANILGAQQNQYLKGYNNLFGTTNGVSNAANTVNSLIGAGKSIAGLFS
jgi:NADH dehydrogenase/NADH:ubiquinone oxidoreductase subunit G